MRTLPRAATGTASATIALIGNPNTGKTTLFNRLTGFNQRVGNYPGVTVERTTGKLKCSPSDRPITIIDLPGTYSLSAGSADEAVVLDALSGRIRNTPTPDAICCVVDAKNLRRNLFLVTQLIELGLPVIVALNMTDLAQAAGIEIDENELAKALGVPVVPVVATRAIGVEELCKALTESTEGDTPPAPVVFPEEVNVHIDRLVTRITRSSDERSIAPPPRAIIAQALLTPGGFHEHRLLLEYGDELAVSLATSRHQLSKIGFRVAEIEADARYAWIGGALARCQTSSKLRDISLTEKADRVLTHPVSGLVILILIMGAVFQSVYAWTAPLIDIIDAAFGELGVYAAGLLPAGALQSLITDGVISGVGAVLVFLPQILVLFLFIAILEDCGYMARAAFLLDRFMRFLGLNGKSFIPLLSSFACAIPGIMAARTIENTRDRLLTVVIAPLMSCSARLPVYMLLIAIFVPNTQLLWGITNTQTIMLLCMYFVGIFTALAVAFVLKRTLLKGESQPFLMEMPTYKWPSPKTVFHRVADRGKQFCIQAGTIIFAMTIVIWALGYYPRPASIAASYEQQRTTLEAEISEGFASLAAAASSDLGILEDSLATDIETLSARFAEFNQQFTDTIEGEGFEEGSEAYVAAVSAYQQRVDELTGSSPLGEYALAHYHLSTSTSAKLNEVDRREAGDYLRQSFLGRIGHFIEPAVSPLGWDWRIGTAAIASFPAREVVIGALGTIFNLGGEQDEGSSTLRSTIVRAETPDGEPLFNLAVALSIMVFFALCCQCGATLATIKRETNTWRWPVFAFVYMTGLAYVMALVTYQVAIRVI